MLVLLGALRFLEGAEAADGTVAVSVVLSSVLLCERFRDLVVGPVPAAALPCAPRPTENELFVLTADVDDVTAAMLRVRG
jgi:hypothetical protein